MSGIYTVLDGGVTATTRRRQYRTYERIGRVTERVLPNVGM
jgi:hypothetical protein